MSDFSVLECSGHKLQLIAMARCFSLWWLVLPFRERNNFTVKLKTYNCIGFN